MDHIAVGGRWSWRAVCFLSRPMMSGNRFDDMASELWAARWIRNGVGPVDRSARAHALLLGDGPHPLSLLRSLVAGDRIRCVDEPLNRGHGVALSFALVQLHVSHPEAIVLVVPGSCRLRRSDVTRDRLARAYLRALRSADAVITIGRSPETGITVARARTLLELFARSLPHLLRLFCFHASLPEHERDRFLEDAYQRLPQVGLERVLRQTRRVCGPPRHTVTDLPAQSGSSPPHVLLRLGP